MNNMINQQVKKLMIREKFNMKLIMIFKIKEK